MIALNRCKEDASARQKSTRFLDGSSPPGKAATFRQENAGPRTLSRSDLTAGLARSQTNRNSKASTVAVHSHSDNSQVLLSSIRIASLISR